MFNTVITLWHCTSSFQSVVADVFVSSLAEMGMFIQGIAGCLPNGNYWEYSFALPVRNDYLSTQRQLSVDHLLMASDILNNRTCGGGF